MAISIAIHLLIDYHARLDLVKIATFKVSEVGEVPYAHL
jgi:hypothetical protein